VHNVRTVDDLLSTLRSAGLRVTPQRQAVWRIIQRADGHVTAESVYAGVLTEQPSISLTTVYQILHNLVEVGLLQQFDLGAGRMVFDTTLRSHHHVVCTRFEVAPPPDDGVHGYVLASTDVVARGLCPACLDAAQPL
jgi:Fe2+ or Zn2+ uptake regulation protein